MSTADPARAMNGVAWKRRRVEQGGSSDKAASRSYAQDATRPSTGVMVESTVEDTLRSAVDSVPRRIADLERRRDQGRKVAPGRAGHERARVESRRDHEKRASVHLAVHRRP